MLAPKIAQKLHNMAAELYDLPTGNRKHFSFILDGRKIISMGWSQSFKTDPMAARFGHRFSNVHSELHTIKQFPYPNSFLPDYTFVNIRIRSDRSLGLSQPCEYCQNLLRFFEIKKLYYSNNDGGFDIG